MMLSARQNADARDIGSTLFLSIVMALAVMDKTTAATVQTNTNSGVEFSPNFLQKYNDFKRNTVSSTVKTKKSNNKGALTLRGGFRGVRSLEGSATNTTVEDVIYDQDGGVCSDIEGWYDTDGDGCDWYENEPNACEDFGDSDMYSNFGHSANSACCFCKSKLCWDVGTPCEEGKTCDRCCSSNTEYWDSLGTTACGFEPCWADGSPCENTLRPDKIESNDICKDGDKFETCNSTKFEKCDDDFMLCYYRLPSNDTFYDAEKIHAVFYVDYSRAKCVPKWNYEANRWWDCDKCTGHITDTSSWCKREGHCMTSDNSKCRCKDTVKDEQKAAERRSYCESNGLIFPEEPLVNLTNGERCSSSSECVSKCCSRRDQGSRKKCRRKKDGRTCL